VLRGGVGVIRAIVQQVRVRQWTKNLVLFAGVIFAHQFMNGREMERAVVGFFSFCLLASTIYVMNDLIDLDMDRVHPKKRLRPIASGRLSIPLAWILMVVFSPGVLLSVSPERFLPVAIGYLILNVLYTLLLKRIVMVDVLAISIGFVLRAVGGVALLRDPVELSPWLLLCTFFLALFLAVGKRRHERVLLQDQAEHHRKTLAEYPPELVDQLIPWLPRR
jgi:4-hydroxybenzoate polyprenyltransferase